MFKTPFDTYSATWQQWIRSVQGQSVKILRASPQVGLSGLPISGWDVEPEQLVSNPTPARKWVPEEWLLAAPSPKAAANIAGKVACNCPLDRILREGCRVSNHE